MFNIYVENQNWKTRWVWKSYNVSVSIKDVICFNVVSTCMLTAGSYQLINSGELTKTLMLLEITEFEQNVSLHYRLFLHNLGYFFINATNPRYIRLWLYNWGSYKKQHLWTKEAGFTDKHNYTERKDFVHFCFSENVIQKLITRL